MRTFKQKLTKAKDQCPSCGLVKDNCICGYDIHLDTGVSFWLLTHENEYTRTSNTGRLIENALSSTRVFRWHRTEQPKELIDLIHSGHYDIYLIFSDDRPSERKRAVSYEPSDKPVVFLILDGTWKEARKMLRKSPYLDDLKLLSLKGLEPTAYDLRRNTDMDHICTVEVAIELLKYANEERASEALMTYFKAFMAKYHAGRNNIEVKND